MNLAWYMNRLRKMGPSEVMKRAIEHLRIFKSRIKYRHPERWPYERFAGNHPIVTCPAFDEFEVPPICDWTQYKIYNLTFDLTKPIDWFFSFPSEKRWPTSHYATIDYRPGNQFGDVRINWELNRLQFLPGMARDDEELAKRILSDWMEKNRFLRGPAYIASMEVALRWISIYRAFCLLKTPIDESLKRKIIGLAVASGRFIESRLSTHSSAGNHLIVESVGLFWIGRALEESYIGKSWKKKARFLLNREILNQINPDGSSREQSYWYLGFVLDAVFHYFILENRQNIKQGVWERVRETVSFLNDMTLPDGGYPDFGDRDDGYVYRSRGDYTHSPFPRLIKIGTFLFDQKKNEREKDVGGQRQFLNKRTGSKCINALSADSSDSIIPAEQTMKTYPDGGMTLMKKGCGRLLFRHAPLGLENLYGHGHADALSILLWWDNCPVLADVGSGQYNGDQRFRNFFRQTIAHNTVELCGTSQATITGPFMWASAYQTSLHEVQEEPAFRVTASHDGYLSAYSTIHQRHVTWPTDHQIGIADRFIGPGGYPFREAFHLGPCNTVETDDHVIIADFGLFSCLIEVPTTLKVDIYHGSQEPFIGWRTKVYGEWAPCYAIICSGVLEENHAHSIKITIVPG